MSKAKKRTYNESYLEYGFSYLMKNGLQLPQCVICLKTFLNDSMKPFQLKQHLQKIHPTLAEKDLDYFQSKERQVKRSRLDANGDLYAHSNVLITASYAVSYSIAQCKKPHTIGETLIKPCMLDCASIVLGKSAEQKFQDLPLSNNTVKRHIDDIAADIEKVVAKIKASPFWAIQLDESTDVASLSQLLVYGRYVHDTFIEEEFLFCQPLLRTTTARDVLKVVENFLEKAKLD
ncbi:protein FAM200C-like [Watersipora subatra]|uniref:protein FAM200C-like n=1 Tax=Watersipora subatra TaxID=2589382 RepID=UPI00355AF26A